MEAGGEAVVGGIEEGAVGGMGGVKPAASDKETVARGAASNNPECKGFTCRRQAEKIDFETPF